MKSCDEMVNSLLERRNQYIAEQKQKRKVLTRTVTSICCVCLVVLLGFGVWKGGMLNDQPPTTLDDSINISEKDYVEPNELNKEQTQGSQSSQQVEQNNSDSQPNNDMTAKHLFALNEITGTVNAAPLYRDPNLHYNEIWDFNKATNYLGVNIPEAVSAISGGNTLKYTDTNEFTVTYENTGAIVEDTMCYEFVGTDDAKITILASKLRPPYDCIYSSDTKDITNIRIPETDEIISLLVYSQNKSETLLEYNFCVIDFEYNGNYYRITGENIRLHNLDALVRQIVK